MDVVWVTLWVVYLWVTNCYVFKKNILSVTEKNLTELVETGVGIASN